MWNKMDSKKIENCRKILEKHGRNNLSDEEVLEISENISALADVILNFEKKRGLIGHQNKPKTTKTSPNKSKQVR
jgi:hypothetical protein